MNRQLSQLQALQLEKIKRERTKRDIDKSLNSWLEQARDKQLTPLGDWKRWLILAGRGFGKTRTGAEDVKAFGLTNPKSRIAVVAPTFADGRDVCFEGESGLLSVLPESAVKAWNRSIGELYLKNGTLYKLYSAEKPRQLRGPQFHRAWCDELAAWRYAETWDMLGYTMRLGQNPQTIITTTPKPVKFLKEIIGEDGTLITTGSTYDNANNLAPAFIERLKRLENSRLGQQEIHALMLEDTPGALWTISQLEQLRVNKVPDLVRIGIGVDPSTTNNEDSAETGIIVCGIDEYGTLYILDDLSLRGLPADWGNAVVSGFNKWRADFIVVEVNNGGDMCEATIRNCKGGQNLPIHQVRATRGKYIRAEPISALATEGKYHHVGYYGDLESQMCTFVPGNKSPDRLDAMVWVATELTGSSDMSEIDANIYNALYSHTGI